MKIRETRAAAFLKTFKDCVGETWKGSETEYPMPRSHSPEAGAPWARGSASIPEEAAEKRHYLRRLGLCLSSAWGDSDRHYHIPKSRHGNVV